MIDQKMKCMRNWDLNIPSELLQEILSRLGLKANIRASVVCKTWFESAVSLRKWQPRPWLFYRARRGSKEGTHILFNPSRRQTYLRNFPELRYSFIRYSQDGWLLLKTYTHNLVCLLNPFTSESVDLPKGPDYEDCLAFSAAPTSSSCLVISVFDHRSTCLTIKTWCPGATEWTTHNFENRRRWIKCVFSNGMLYCLSTCGQLGIFDPSRETWNIPLVETCPTPADLTWSVLMTEHEGDIFLRYTSRGNNHPVVLKLNLERKVWEEKRELSGLTIFASYTTSLARAGPSAEERNIIYPWYDIRSDGKGMWDFLCVEKSSPTSLPITPFSFDFIAWVAPPHNNFNF